MKLLTEAQRAKLIENGRRQAAVKGTAGELDLWPVVKLFNPCGAATWLLTELDPDDASVYRKGVDAVAFRALLHLGGSATELSVTGCRDRAVIGPF
jgi:hypothetical protein